MNDTEIKAIIRRLDEAIPKDGATVSFRAFGETAVMANPRGYLRLGIEFMKFAFNDTNDRSDIDYMVTKDSDFSIDYFTTSQSEFDSISS